jgi:hypothetical protein
VTTFFAIALVGVVAFFATLAQDPHCIEPETQDAVSSIYLHAGQEERAWIAVGGTDQLCED